MSSIVNHLANPKGSKKTCELCDKPAHIQCTKCCVTFYCNEEHQQADWAGVHERVCQLLVPLRVPLPFHMLQANREHQSAQMLQRQEQLMQISQAVAEKKLFGGRHQEALPAAQLLLRTAGDVYGPSSVLLVPTYLLLAEANIGLGSLSQAEEYLSQAEWTVMKTPVCSRSILHQLHRSLGKLHIAKGDLEGALFHLANDIYYASEEFGLDSTVTCGGYLLMADVFAKQEKTDTAVSLYTKVTNIWHAHLIKLTTGHSRRSSLPEHALDEVQLAQADTTLRTVLEVQEHVPGQCPRLTALAGHALAMLWLLGNNHAKAEEFGRRALACSQLVQDCGLTEDIEKLLGMLASVVPTQGPQQVSQ